MRRSGSGVQQRVREADQFVRPGLLAGFVGAVAIDAYLLAIVVGATHSVGLAQFYEFVASAAIGPSAYGNPAAAALGAALHVAVSLAWAVGYAYVAARTPQVRSHPLTSGTVFGIVVLIAMQIVEVAANVYRVPTTFSLANAFVAHVVFFGLPIATIVSRLQAR